MFEYHCPIDINLLCCNKSVTIAVVSISFAGIERNTLSRFAASYSGNPNSVWRHVWPTRGTFRSRQAEFSEGKITDSVTEQIRRRASIETF
jgi:hypothetical protein